MKAVTENQYDKFMSDAVNLPGDVIGTNNPNLEPFRMAGGKLILWHGWNDQLIYPRATVNFYTHVAEASGPANADQFVRLFGVRNPGDWNNFWANP